MKKSLTRVLSLVLVLVMMLGVVPMASANYPDAPASVSISGVPESAKVGDTLSLTANLVNWIEPEERFLTPTLTWNINGVSKSGKNVTYKVEAADAGKTLNISVTASFTHASHASEYPNFDSSSDSETVEIADAYTVTIPANLSLKPGTTKAITATVTKNGAADSIAVVWESDNENVSVVGGEVVATSDATGTATLTAKVMVGGEKVAEDTCEVTILSGYTVTVSPATKKAKVGDTVNFTATVKDVDEKTITPAAGTLTWNSSNSKVVHQGNGKFAIAADATGTSNITATYTAGGKSYTSTAAVLTIEDGAYVVTVNPDTLALVMGADSQLSAVVTTKDGAAVTPASGELTWHSSDETIATVVGGKVTASATKGGKVIITAKYTKNSLAYTGTCEVTVSGATITCANYSAQDTTSNSHQLNPVYGNSNTGVYYSYTRVSGTASVSATGLVTSSDPAFAEVKITAYSDPAKTEASKLDEKTVWVTFYDYNNISVTMPSGATQLDFDEKEDLQNSTKNLRTLMLANTLGGTSTSTIERCYFEYSDKTQSVGKLTGFVPASTYVNVGNLGGMTFQVTGGAGGKYTYVYTIVKNGLTDVVLLKGQVTINFDGSVADIEYSTTYNKPVTFKESDFSAFWKAAKMDSALDYVQFGVTSYVPKYGELYNSTSKTSSGYVVSAGQKYYYGSYTATSSTYDLGSVTYVPDKDITNTVNVEIPFTAVGTDSTEKVSGTVVIKLNEKGNVITSRGITFGSKYSGSLTYVDQMMEAYKDATGQTLDYVIFEQPEPEQGSLYSKLPATNRVAQATLLKKDVKLYTSRTTGELELDDVALVPAAGYAKKINLTYTGYDVNGETAKKLTITFEVKAKSASAVFTDVNAKNYSWASDSVDFLYYEGTAQGSNGKYNPSANITRRDFMLMLYRAFLAEDYGTFTVTSNFPDVVKGADSYSKEIYQAVGVAKYLGIAQGTNNKFNPTSNITRQEAMVLIYRTLETINKDLRTDSGVKLTSMKDYSKISSWATTAISNLVGHGVIKGNNDNIKPLDPISRAEMAAILHRVITY